MKNSIMTILPIVFILDLLIPFILAPAYKGYNHLIQVMSVLGNSKAPLHIIYNAWLVVFGITLIVIDFNVYAIISESSKLIAVTLFVILLIYAIGGCILSGLFPVGEVKSLATLSEKIHGYGSVIGFSCFVMGDKPNYKNTVLAFEGLWQRLSLLFMYLPLGCLILLEK